MSFNSALIVLGAMGVLPPATSSLLHNASTLGVSLKSMKNCWVDYKHTKTAYLPFGGGTPLFCTLLTYLDRTQASNAAYNRSFIARTLSVGSLSTARS